MFKLNKGKAKKKDNRTYNNLHYMPTKKLLEIINEPYNRGIDGHEYEDYIDDINRIYLERLQKIAEKASNER